MFGLEVALSPGPSGVTAVGRVIVELTTLQDRGGQIRLGGRSTVVDARFGTKHLARLRPQTICLVNEPYPRRVGLLRTPFTWESACNLQRWRYQMDIHNRIRAGSFLLVAALLPVVPNAVAKMVFLGGWALEHEGMMEAGVAGMAFGVVTSGFGAFFSLSGIGVAWGEAFVIAGMLTGGIAA